MDPVRLKTTDAQKESKLAASTGKKSERDDIKRMGRGLILVQTKGTAWMMETKARHARPRGVKGYILR